MDTNKIDGGDKMNKGFFVVSDSEAARHEYGSSIYRSERDMMAAAIHDMPATIDEAIAAGCLQAEPSADGSETSFEVSQADLDGRAA